MKVLDMVEAKRKPFSERDVTVTLTGAQWVTVLGRILRLDLSPEGERTYHEATKRMEKQILAANKEASK
jgi:hypothetical protein